MTHFVSVQRLRGFRMRLNKLWQVIFYAPPYHVDVIAESLAEKTMHAGAHARTHLSETTMVTPTGKPIIPGTRSVGRNIRKKQMEGEGGIMKRERRRNAEHRKG